jgi:hypothetical protein
VRVRAGRVTPISRVPWVEEGASETFV